MSKKIRTALSLLFSLIILFSTTFFGQVKSNYFSAYATCRKTAMNTKGYAVWKYEKTNQKVFLSEVIFSDGYNELTCSAFGIGPFWITGFSFYTLVGCLKNLYGGMCPEDYFGVAP